LTTEIGFPSSQSPSKRGREIRYRAQLKGESWYGC
jgi:hypothetical protein